MVDSCDETDPLPESNESGADEEDGGVYAERKMKLVRADEATAVTTTAANTLVILGMRDKRFSD